MFSTRALYGKVYWTCVQLCLVDISVNRGNGSGRPTTVKLPELGTDDLVLGRRRPTTGDRASGDGRQVVRTRSPCRRLLLAIPVCGRRGPISWPATVVHPKFGPTTVARHPKLGSRRPRRGSSEAQKWDILTHGLFCGFKIQKVQLS